MVIKENASFTALPRKQAFGKRKENRHKEAEKKQAGLALQQNRPFSISVSRVDQKRSRETEMSFGLDSVPEPVWYSKEPPYFGD